MKKGAKILMMNANQRERDPNIVEDRFRDRRGREHYDNGRFAPMNNWPDAERENRREEPRGDGIAIWNQGGEYWPRYPHIPPYSDRMDTIGFEREPKMNGGYHMWTDNRAGEEMEHHQKTMQNGHAMGSMKFTPEMAEEWTKSMKNEDGTKGPHWTQEQAKKVMAQRGIVYDPISFWAILNSLYSDFCGVFKKHGVNNMEFYADLTTAWLNDQDAVHDKAGAYYAYIVKH